jgi:hypothetical protein
VAIGSASEWQSEATERQPDAAQRTHAVSE